jgi:hypothetical protein
VIQRTLLLLTAIWAFALSPVLCMAGLMSHACEPHDDHSDVVRSSCVDAACDCDSHDEPCSHESDCSSDPCRLNVTAKNPSRDALESIVNASIFVDLPVSTVSSHQLLRGCLSAPPRARGPAFFIHNSDLPLLI